MRITKTRRTTNYPCFFTVVFQLSLDSGRGVLLFSRTLENFKCKKINGIIKLKRSFLPNALVVVRKWRRAYPKAYCWILQPQNCFVIEVGAKSIIQIKLVLQWSLIDFCNVYEVKLYKYVINQSLIIKTYSNTKDCAK